MTANTYNPHNVYHEEMVEAFDLVADPDDWKAPVDGFIDEVDLVAVAAAVTYFTATVARATPGPIPGRYHITADGYRAGPAGDR
jgi:hypothetical protein